MTDGDVRRALLEGHGLDSPADAAYNTEYMKLLAQDRGVSGQVFRMRPDLKELPVVDLSGRLLCIEQRSEGQARPDRPNTVVIMAGGKGLRLRPLTEETPKPLLLVGGKPILQHIIDSLRGEGFTDIVLAINYLGEQIEEFFQDGSRFGVNVRYLKEDRALGTAGALSLLRDAHASPVVVMNGDLILSSSIGKMLDYHEENLATITVGAKVVETIIPYGVMTTNGRVIEGIEEKPTRRDLVNAGVYVLNPEVLASVIPDQVTDMPQLIIENLKGRKALAFPLHETWADLGSPQQLKRAHDLLVGE